MVKRKIKVVFNFFKIIINKDFIPYKGLIRSDLLIFDDVFPHPFSGFRFEEFSILLTSFKKSRIFMTPLAYPALKTPKTEHKKHIKEFLHLHKTLKSKLKCKTGFVNINTRLFYCIFLNNIFSNLKWLERYKIPFVFTLYPGGGFQVDDDLADLKLKKVFDSPMFKKVIVTQSFTYDYLLNKNFCKEENIEFIFGCVVPQKSLKIDLTNKKSYLLNKATFDICFCATKYTPKGEDKGYDVFINFANKIAANYEFIRFHVIGGFDENDIDISMIKEEIHFYGYQNFDSLSSIFKNIDVIVSPNKPFVLNNGGFDGFPLGTVVEAVFNGVVAVISDRLKQNINFIPNEDLILIETEIGSIEKEIIDLINRPEKLYLISKKGKEKFKNIYSNEFQMIPRIALLRNEIDKA